MIEGVDVGVGVGDEDEVGEEVMDGVGVEDEVGVGVRDGWVMIGVVVRGFDDLK